jgi:hypothetical protein
MSKKAKSKSSRLSRKGKTVRERKIQLPRSLRRLFPNLDYAVDATKSIEVSVNKADCESAEPLNPTECALAKAAKREFHADAAVIGMSASYIIKGNKAIRYQTPESVRREIVSFDRHSDFEPGTYSLPPKCPSLRLGHKKSGPSGSSHRKQIIHHKKSIRVREMR